MVFQLHSHLIQYGDCQLEGLNSYDRNHKHTSDPPDWTGGPTDPRVTLSVISHRCFILSFQFVMTFSIKLFLITSCI